MKRGGPVMLGEKKRWLMSEVGPGLFQRLATQGKKMVLPPSVASAKHCGERLGECFDVSPNYLSGRSYFIFNDRQILKKMLV